MDINSSRWDPATALNKPLRWKKPRRIFVSDPYHDDVPFEFIAAVYGVMAACPQHTFIILTKRTTQMREFHEVEGIAEQIGWEEMRAVEIRRYTSGVMGPTHLRLPLPNVIHGYSASTQADLDAGMPDLLATPSALRCLSLEPLIGPIDASACLGLEWSEIGECLICERDHAVFGGRKIDWIIVCGESGPGARPCDVAWIHSIVDQCKAAGVPCFVKQLGDVRILSPGTGLPYYRKLPHYREWFHQIKARKGGDPSEWPAELRVRQFPEVARE